MRIFYLSTDPGIRLGGAKGAGVHVAEMVEAMAAEGAEVLLAVAGVEPGAIPPTDVPVVELPTTTGDVASWLVSRLKNFGADVLYERFALNSDAGARAARSAGIPHIVELNAPLVDEAVRYRRLEDPASAARLEASVLASADLVLAVSPPLAEYASQRGARRVEVSQNAAAIERYGAPRRDSHAPSAVFAGSLRPWHGLETIAEAWRQMGAEAPRLRIIGDGPARDLLNGVDAQFYGHVAPSAVPAFLADADIGLAPYGRDTPDYFSPIKLFEYLAAGLATVVGDLPAVRSIVDADSALVIPAGDAQALADAVLALAADSAERRRLGDNGRALVEFGHTWRHRARHVLDAAATLRRAEAVA